MTNNQSEDIAAIAAGLTKAQREALIHKGGLHAVVISPEMDPLWFSITKVRRDYFSISLTRLGLHVRAYIQEQGHD